MADAEEKQRKARLGKASRFMTKVLRHRATELGLTLREDGFVRLEDLTKLQPLKSLELADVQEIVRTDNKQRFSLQQEADQEWWIRANQGHSIKSVETEALLEKVDLSLLPQCIHGTYLRHWPAIQRQGLRRMGRNHVHFASGLPGQDGVLSGFRGSAEVLIFLDTARAHDAGLEMFRSSNGVLLTPGLGDTGAIPTELFLRVEERRSHRVLWPAPDGATTEPANKMEMNKRSADRDSEAANASKHSRSAPTPPSKAKAHNKKLSHMLSRVLRHSAVQEGLEVREDGFVRLAELQGKLKRFKGISFSDIEAVVRDNDKKRFTLRQDTDGSWLIRANQGHSMSVVKETSLLRPLDPTSIETCLHGTNASAWAQIQDKGLSRMKRNHIHFARGLPSSETGVISGMRKSCDVLVYVDAAAAAAEAGIKFFESDNGVILSPGDAQGMIAPRFFTKVTDRMGLALAAKNLKSK
ncbi:tRNA 2'-phosphotransferase 1 [Hondaea fermentalgiana]|uniref:2'-phosphotransferase n=1 Tax=Hondaea fermentalgiana TaxID=2315210 RepID=A0A2R5GFL4_9STRA|nr:tRNA 2'-phosphotransferase 1 [Hondaea fermentalgiana]|eukprot:GBG29716.1 tRNA 2'-phosphotransferase 1 [Hondaea fermentalgiana]